MYSFDSKVRYSEVDHNCNMDLISIINYFQDCSCFQSEDLGVGVEYQMEQNCAWLLNSWQIIVNRFPRFTEKVTTSTWAYHFDHVYGYRNFLLQDAQGEILAMANSNWIYVDIKAAHPLKITPEIASVYPIEPRLELFPYASRKIKIPNGYTEYEPFVIQLNQIDSNNHVNNGQYIKMAQQYLPDDFKIWQMRAEYKRQALLGDTLIPRVTLIDHICTVTLVNADAKPYCVIEFIQNDNLELV